MINIRKALKINQSFQECMDMDEVMERIDELIRQKQIRKNSRTRYGSSSFKT